MRWIERYILSTTLAQNRGVAGAKMPYMLPNGDILPNVDKILKATIPVWQKKKTKHLGKGKFWSGSKCKRAKELCPHNCCQLLTPKIPICLK